MQMWQEDRGASHGRIQDLAASISSAFPYTGLGDHQGGGPSQHVYLEPCKSGGKSWKIWGRAGAGQRGAQGSPAEVWWQQPKPRCPGDTQGGVTLGRHQASRWHRGPPCAPDCGDRCQPAVSRGATAAFWEGFEFFWQREKLGKASRLAELFLGLNFINSLKTGAGKPAFHPWWEKRVCWGLQNTLKKGGEKKKKKLCFPP